MTTLLFLGGTCGNNHWRKEFTKTLTKCGVHPDVIFDPVVEDWTEEARRAEEEAKAKCSHFLYYLADPKLDGLNVSGFSMLEATIALFDHPATTVVVFDTEGMAGHSLKAMNQAAKVLKKRFPNGKIFTSAAESLNFLVPQLCCVEATSI
jgi:hypothetical protein